MTTILPFYIVATLRDVTKEDFGVKWDSYETKLFNNACSRDQSQPSWDEHIEYLQSKLENKVMWPDADVPEAWKFSVALLSEAAAHFPKAPQRSQTRAYALNGKNSVRPIYAISPRNSNK